MARQRRQLIALFLVIAMAGSLPGCSAGLFRVTAAALTVVGTTALLLSKPRRGPAYPREADETYELHVPERPPVRHRQAPSQVYYHNGRLIYFDRQTGRWTYYDEGPLPR